jgi:hypothetical protein
MATKMVTEEKKMKSKLALIVTLPLAVMLTTYSGYVSAKSDISQAWKGERTSRTWTVFEFDGEKPDEFHLQEGDKFQIEARGNSKIHFVPLKVLRKRWGRQEGTSIQLEKGKKNQKLCGPLNLYNHPGNSSHKQHFIKVEADPGDENKIFITISDDANFECATASHGGRVHAEN